MSLKSLFEFLHDEYGVSAGEAVDYLHEEYEISSVISLVPETSSDASDNDDEIVLSSMEGTRGADLIIGDIADNVIRARKGDDMVFGMGGNDKVFGGKGADHLIGDFLPSSEDFDEQGYLIQSEGKSFNDTLVGGDGDDILVDQYGADRLKGGDGDDRLVSVSDSGTPRENPRVEVGDTLEELKFSSKFFNPENYESNDRLTGGDGADVFEWNLLINAPKDIVERNTDAGVIRWGMDGVAGENNNYHDHWVDGIGRDVITDFSGKAGEGDQIVIKGHTVAIALLSDEDGRAVIGVYSDQGGDEERGGGAHDFDVLGKIVVFHDDAFDFDVDVEVESVDYGAYGQGSDIFDVFQFT